jgi:hypothetical protein
MKHFLPEPEESIQIKAQVVKELREELTKAGVPTDKIQFATDAFIEVSHGYIFRKKSED